MGYQVQYGKATMKERVALIQITKKAAKVKWIIIAGLMIFAVLLGKLGYLDYLIPGDKVVTKSAFHTMIEDVREGEDMKTAISAFCMEILENAGYED